MGGLGEEWAGPRKEWGCSRGFQAFLLVLHRQPRLHWPWYLALDLLPFLASSLPPHPEDWVPKGMYTSGTWCPAPHDNPKLDSRVELSVCETLDLVSHL